jgi:RimJ/RimL family protein N-acetyltransferase
MPVSVPTLTTARLTLRAPIADDFPAYRDMVGSDRARYMGGPYDGWAAWGMFCHEIACWDMFGHGGLVIERKNDGVAVGIVSINAGPLFPEQELGWMLYEGFEGRGYATEAARALRDWAIDQPFIEALVSYFDPANTASIAVARRLGAVPDPSAPVQDEGDVVYRHR